MSPKESIFTEAKIIVFSLLSWVAAVVLTVTYNSLGVFVALPLSYFWDPNRRLVHILAQGWGKALIFCSPWWGLTVEGKENLERGRNYVVVGNHQSMLDIVVACAGLPLQFKFIAKKELFSIPFMGWHMAAAGYIPLDREKRESGRRVMFAAAALLGRGVSVLFFPEGTRSPDGQIRNFKPGAFKLAQEGEIDVLPIVIDGTGDAIPKKSWRMRKQTRFILSIGKPVRIAKGEVLEDGINLVRDEMVARLAAIRSRSSGK